MARACSQVVWPRGSSFPPLPCTTPRSTTCQVASKAQALTAPASTKPARSSPCSAGSRPAAWRKRETKTKNSCRVRSRSGRRCRPHSPGQSRRRMIWRRWGHWCRGKAVFIGKRELLTGVMFVSLHRQGAHFQPGDVLRRSPRSSRRAGMRSRAAWRPAPPWPRRWRRRRHKHQANSSPGAPPDRQWIRTAVVYVVSLGDPASKFSSSSTGQWSEPKMSP